MKNVLICNNCKSENAFFAYHCSKCNAFLRTKVANIDLWETVTRLIDSPVKADEKIIHSENKNFVGSLLILIAVKFSFILMILHNGFYNTAGNSISFSSSFLSGGVGSVILLSMTSFVITIINNSLGIKNRFKDNLAIYTYSFFPIIGALVVLSPIQYALFGEYWFTFNPSPLLIKPAASLILFIIEALLLLWSGCLIIISTYCQTRNRLYSIISGTIIFLIEIVFIIILL